MTNRRGISFLIEIPPIQDPVTVIRLFSYTINNHMGHVTWLTSIRELLRYGLGIWLGLRFVCMVRVTVRVYGQGYGWDT